jgi:hypothetical protein
LPNLVTLLGRKIFHLEEGAVGLELLEAGPSCLPGGLQTFEDLRSQNGEGGVNGLINDSSLFKYVHAYENNSHNIHYLKAMLSESE